MPSTTHGLPYPASSAAPNIPSDMQALAVAVDAALGRAGAGLQEGVIDAGSFMVTQKGAGANMSVDVASSSGTGAYVQDDTISGQGLQYIAPFTTTNVAIGANASGNPRVDQVVLSSAGVVSVVAGTATAGATLDNRTGAAALPTSAMRLADVLVANGAATIPNSVIRDRRPWARGAYMQTVRSSADYTITTGTLTAIDATNLSPRIECSGFPVRVTLNGYWTPATTNQFISFALYQDGVSLSLNRSLSSQTYSTAPALPVAIEWVTVPTAGSHIITPRWASDGANLATLRAGGSTPLIFTVEEIARQNTANNTTTTG